MRSGVICATARCNSRLAATRLRQLGAIAEFGDLPGFEFRLRDDFAVHLDEHLLHDFRPKRNRGGEGGQTGGDNRLLQHNNSLNINILLDVSAT